MKRFWKALTVLLFLLYLVGGGLVAADQVGTIGESTSQCLSVLGYGWTDLTVEGEFVHSQEGDLMIVQYTPGAQPAVGQGVLVYKSGPLGQFPAVVTSADANGLTIQVTGGNTYEVQPEAILAVYVARIPRLAWAIGWMRQPMVWAVAFLALLSVYVVHRLWPAPYFPDDDAPLSPKDADIETLLGR